MRPALLTETTGPSIGACRPSTPASAPRAQLQGQAPDDFGDRPLVREAFAYRVEADIRLKVGDDLLTIALGRPLLVGFEGG